MVHVPLLLHHGAKFLLLLCHSAQQRSVTAFSLLDHKEVPMQLKASQMQFNTVYLTSVNIEMHGTFHIRNI